LKSALLPLVYKCMRAADIDPVEGFKKNFVQAGDTYRWRDNKWHTARDIDYTIAMDAAAEKFHWKDKWKGWLKPTRAEGHKVVGIGVGVHGNADVGEDNSEAYVRLEPNGRAVIHLSIVECGQGQRTALVKMAAEVLQLPMESVDIVPNGTLLNPHEFTTGGSRGTRTMGSAVSRGAMDAKTQLLKLAADKFFYNPEDLDTEDGYVYVIKDPENRRWNWSEIMPKATTLTGKGRYYENFEVPNFCILFVEVEVDLETGAVKLIDVCGGTDVGQIIDPKALEMQYHGGFGSAGTDTAFFEESVLDTSTGRLLTGNMVDYKWRTFNEFPPFATSTLESQFTAGKFRAVGFGEIAGSPGPAATMMAISNAIGMEFCEYPATPAAILKALGKV